MKKIFDIKKMGALALGLVAFAPAASAQDEVETTIAADVVNQYYWRGQSLGEVSLQPTLCIGYKGLSLTAWGSVGVSKPDDTKEFDLTLAYETGGFHIGVTDYWFNSPNEKYFAYKAHETSHVFEANVGCALSIIVNYNMVKGDHTYAQVTGNETFNTHDPNGNILYGIEVFIHPDYRGLRLARRMYEYRKELCEKLNLKAIMFGGRIPNYHKYADKMRPKEYIEHVRNREIYDPVLTFQLSNDFHVRRVIRNYLPSDEESEHCATLLQWDNIYYQPPTDSYVDRKPTVRIGLVQWQMRPYASVDDLFEQVEFFVDSVSDYKSDFILFPEYFNAPLMARFNDLGEAQSIRKMAQYTEEIRDRFRELAISYNINIITGSMPYLKDDSLYNVGFLCRRDGSVDMYEKIHVTPDEQKCWGLSGGSHIQTFDTDCGKIGIVICYDVEFPELSRLMAEDGMQILFVPFMTDTQNAYSRVRVCAQARAIENECYVAIAGSVGNLPRVHNMDIQYAQSAVFTPCDFAFPNDGKRSEATPNTEMILVSDVDLNLLNELHTYGAVRNLRDRRKDLYELKQKK